MPNVIDFMPTGTRTGSGHVVKHDLTAHGLGRMVIEQADRYPDLDTWVDVLISERKQVMTYNYSQKLHKSFFGYLWLFYKEA